MKKITQSLCAAVVLISLSANAQSTGEVLKTSQAVRLIDNKGTIKFLQANNGLTQIINSTNEKTTTTWQLGGTLTDNTYIDVNGKVFGFDKLDLVPAGALSSTNATDKSVHGTTSTGWTLLVRDEASGAIQKLLASELISSGETIEIAPADAEKIDITTTGIKSTTLKSRIWVYRNGVKLLPTDYSVSENKISVNQLLGTGNNSYVINKDDVFEVQWLK